MTKYRECIECGEEFPLWDEEDVRCDVCSGNSLSSSIKTKTCRNCGELFEGLPYDEFCPICEIKLDDYPFGIVKDSEGPQYGLNPDIRS